MDKICTPIVTDDKITDKDVSFHCLLFISAEGKARIVEGKRLQEKLNAGLAVVEG